MSSGYAVILVQSTSHAVRGESLLRKAGIACKLIPVPRHLSSDCCVCLRVAAVDKQASSQALSSLGDIRWTTMSPSMGSR